MFCPDLDTGTCPPDAALGILLCGVRGDFAVFSDCGSVGSGEQCVFADADWHVVCVGGYFVLRGGGCGAGSVGSVCAETKVSITGGKRYDFNIGI